MSPRTPKTKEKRPSPSRIRYERANPTVSLRISRELRDGLAEAKAQHGHSLGDILRIGLEKASPDLTAAHSRGYTAALSECLGITDHCPECYPKVCELIPDDAD